MIQRIQTIFLLGAFGLMLSMFFLTFAQNETESIMYIDHIYFTILIAAGTLLPLVTIFLFKNRMLQIRLSTISTIVMLGLQAWILYVFFELKGQASFSTSAVFPAVAAILTILAIRYIAKDEALVRASDHFRKPRK